MRLITLFGAILVFASLQAQTYKLVWEDNFDGQSLDSSKWNVEQKVGVWNTGSNAEFQHYRSENVTVGDDGNGNNCLILTAKKENFNGYAYTSGRVNTKGKFGFKRGKLEASIKIPDLANGLWPAFWTLGYTPVGWPDCGEIDVLEMGHQQGITDGVQNRYMGSHLFWGPYPSDYGKNFVATQDLNTGYFKHTLVWNENSISVYFNDAASPYFTMGIAGDNTEEFRNFRDYIILNLAVGGSVPGIFNASGITAGFPASMYIDWVKVYQAEGSEDFSTNPALYGDFGIYEEVSSADMRMDLGYDLFAEKTGLTDRAGETPFEGSEVLSYAVTSQQDFSLSLNAGLLRNMSGYNEGSVQFAIKTNLTNDILIGLADDSGVEKFITFSSTDDKSFARDSKWHKAYFKIADLGAGIDLASLKKMLIVKGTAAADGYFSIDQVVFKETVPASGYYGVFTDNPLITQGFIVDNVTTHLYVWNNTVTFNEYYPAYEGENVHSFKSSGAESWYGFGYFSSSPLNFEAYANGYLNISIRTKSTQEFYIGMDGDGSNGEIHFISGSDGYGFKRDGLWHQLHIPVSNLVSAGLNLSSVKHVFKTGGSSIADLAYDDIYFSEGVSTIENSNICHVAQISITPASKTLDIGKKQSFKATVKNQFGNAFDNKVVWSASGGTISTSGIFSSDSAGDFTITATQENISATASVKVTATGVNDKASQLIIYYDTAGDQLIVKGVQKSGSYTVYNLTGQVVCSGISNQSEIAINMENQPSGMYVYRFETGNGMNVGKFIKP